MRASNGSALLSLFTILPGCLGENPKFVDLRLSTVNTADKLNSVFAPVTRAEGLTYHSDRLASMHRIAEVTADRASEAKAYRDYIKNYEFETKNVFEREILLGFD